jgi:hypothetical protein
MHLLLYCLDHIERERYREATKHGGIRGSRAVTETKNIRRGSCTAAKRSIRLSSPARVSATETEHDVTISTIAPVRVWMRRFALLVIIAAAPSSLAAQTIDPRTVEFTASPDHDRVVDGVPIVTAYSLQFFVVGTAIPLQTIDLGKPSPASDGVIRFTFESLLGSWPVAGAIYEARVSAIGPGGAAPSESSNQFTFPSPSPPPPPPPGPPPPPACSLAVSPSSRSTGASATTGTVAVIVGSGCQWSAASSASWLTITSGRSGTANGAINYNVSSNSSASVRVATITVGTATFMLTQNGICTYTVTPTSQSFNPTGGAASVTVSTAPGCAWTATRSGSWISIGSDASGSGNGTVRFHVSANTGSAARTGTLTVAGQPVTITQSALTTPSVPGGLRIVGRR